MRLLIDATTTQDQFANRGIGVATKETVAGLLEKATTEGNEDIFDLLLFDAPTTLQKLLREYPKRINTVEIGSLRLSGKFDSLWWRTRYLPNINRVLKNQNVDVYYAPYIFRGLPVGALPTVAYVHDFALPIMGRYSSAPRLLDWIRKYQYHSSLKHLCKVDKIATNSDRTRKDLLKFVDCITESDTNTVYLGISDSFTQIKPRREILLKYLPPKVLEHGYFLYYGGVEVNKNVSGLIRGYKEFLNMWSHVLKSEKMDTPPYLVLAGGDFTRLDMRNSQIREVRSRIHELDLREHVEFTGFFEDKHLVHLLNGAKLFVHLSYYEGFGFSPLEAMKSGVPVIASDKSCYPEVLGDGAILVDPDNHEDVGRAILSLVSNESEAKKQAEKGMKQAKKYTWKKTADDLYKIFRDVASQSNRG